MIFPSLAKRCLRSNSIYSSPPGLFECRELADSRRVIEDLFGREVTGFTAPGGHGHGFIGETELLEAVWEAGYRYVRTLSWQANNAAPAPLTQPFWFSGDGFPELLEISAHAWHDNILTGQPATAAWPPALPWGYPARLPTTAREVYDRLRSRHRALPRPGAAHLRPLLPSLVDLPGGPRGRADRPAARARPRGRPDPGFLQRRVLATWQPNRSSPIRPEVRLRRPGLGPADRQLSTDPAGALGHELELSADEHHARKLQPEHLQRAVAALQEDGFVILQGAIGPAHIEILGERMLADVDNILALAAVPYQFNDGHLQQDPPPFPPYLFREERLRDEHRPLQPTVPAGSVLIRDMRLWHRGMPNLTGQPRPMIAMIHWVRWWHTDKPLLFPRGTEELFADSPLETVAEFVDGRIDYISRKRKYDYPG